MAADKRTSSGPSGWKLLLLVLFPSVDMLHMSYKIVDTLVDPNDNKIDSSSKIDLSPPSVEAIVTSDSTLSCGSHEDQLVCENGDVENFGRMTKGDPLIIFVVDHASIEGTYDRISGSIGERKCILNLCPWTLHSFDPGDHLKYGDNVFWNNLNMHGMYGLPFSVFKFICYSKKSLCFPLDKQLLFLVSCHAYVDSLVGSFLEGCLGKREMRHLDMASCDWKGSLLPKDSLLPPLVVPTYDGFLGYVVNETHLREILYTIVSYVEIHSDVKYTQHDGDEEDEETLEEELPYIPVLKDFYNLLWMANGKTGYSLCYGYVEFRDKLDCVQAYFTMNDWGFIASQKTDEVEMHDLRARDQGRHGRMLQQLSGIVDFPLQGSYDPSIFGIYFTRVRLGFPPKDFYVVIDTGSDVLWVSCVPCNGCPTYSLVQNRLEFFDPSSSSTARPVLCSDKICAIGGKSCAAQNHCGYAIHYGDGSGTSGYYIADFMHFDTIPLTNSSSRIVFGCSTYRTGELLTKPDKAIDGSFGLGQLGFLVIAQLATQGVTPNVFSHCLKGSNGRGGVLVLGQAVEPNLVYTPLVPSQPHYSIILEGIALNGQTLSINPELFKTRNNRGFMVDSGTTLAYLPEEAHDIFLNAINEAVSQKVRLVVSLDLQCYITTSSVSDIFPMVSLNYAGGATMVLRGEDYLIHRYSTGGSEVWCMSFQKSLTQGCTILGEVVLKDKIIVYDLDGQRIG
ncbi:hypothetical protein CQW23_04826 [Capsicum baccatum]|uniref:Peptidase A1 domain-containing protein n=1 Tax=Capsicum baccatum TaxID=33114 RepID=A0A2G2XFT2_CAPBA|nr:hypothetical protein CQW23_04826 [Capsicum baccatum]